MGKHRSASREGPEGETASAGVGGHTLVIHPGALGDVLLAVPALRALRASAPDRAVVLAAQPRLGGMLASLGVVDDVLDFESLGLAALFAGDGEAGGLDPIRQAGRVVCWFGSGDATFVRTLLALQPGAVVAPPAAGELAVWQYLRQTLGAPASGDAEVIPVPPSLLTAGGAVLREAGWDGITPLVVLHPGAGGPTKRWPAEGFAALSERGLLDPPAALPAALVVHEGPADAEAVATLRSRVTRPILRLPSPPLTVLAGALRLAALYVGNDSGVSHLAAAVGAPSVILFSEALLAWRPWARAARVVTVSSRELREADLTAVREAARATLA